MIPDDIEEPGRKKALAFTILVHAGLIAALILGVQWKRSQPDAVEVELWSSRQMPAVRVAPAPPPPPEARPEPKPEPKPVPKVEPKPEPPPPVKPDIAIKEEKKPPKPEPKKPEPEPKNQNLSRSPNRKTRAQAGAEKAGSQARGRSPSSPRHRISARILASETAHLKARPNTSGQQMSNAAAAEAEQRAAAGKKGLQDYAPRFAARCAAISCCHPTSRATQKRSSMSINCPVAKCWRSGSRNRAATASLDAAIERAIRKSSPLPPPDDPALFRRDLEIKYKPFEE